jgi:dTDP-4-dehydrorhamnose reductase
VTRWLVVGALGMLGRDLVAALDGEPVTAVDREDGDITDPDVAASRVSGHDVVVNCAAWTAVDAAESQEAAAFAVNAVGAANLARACARTGARLVQLSTDYVFDGELRDPPVPHDEDGPVAPRSAYGRTKAAGEWAVRAELPGRHWILRTAWLYGAHGPSFVRTMARLERTRESVDVVDDQYGQPTWTVDLARRIRALVEAEVPAGTYHATSTGHTTWYDLARQVFTLLGADPARVRPTTSDRYVRPARRPPWSVLGHDAWRGTGLDPLPPWQDSLHRALVEADLLGWFREQDAVQG